MRPELEIGVPYFAAVYDERMFEELHRRPQLFEVTMGGVLQIDDRCEASPEEESRRRAAAGIDATDEDLGEAGETAAVPLPEDLVERLRPSRLEALSCLTPIQSEGISSSSGNGASAG